MTLPVKVALNLNTNQTKLNAGICFRWDRKHSEKSRKYWFSAIFFFPKYFQKPVS